MTDVSAELGQLARLCSIPHVAVMQHGERSDPGHMAAYDSAVGLLAPYAEQLEQHDRPARLRCKTHYASGVGIDCGELMSLLMATPNAIGVPSRLFRTLRLHPTIWNRGHDW